MRLVLVSSHTFGRRAFEGIVSSPEYLGGGLTVPLVIGGSCSRHARAVGYANIEEFAAENDLIYLEAQDERLIGNRRKISAAAPDLLAVIGWSYLIPEEILNLARGVQLDSKRVLLGVGMHPTRLPAGRGQAPIPWTIIRGLDATALSTFGLVASEDAGPLLQQSSVKIHPRETAASLFYRMSTEHFEAGRALAALLCGTDITAVEQDEQQASRWSRRTPDDGEILATMTVAGIDRLVRGLTGPYPRAFLRQGTNKITIGSLSEYATDACIPFNCVDGTAFLRPSRH